VAVFLAATYHLSLITCHIAEAAVSKGTDKELQAAETNQGGGTATSSRFSQQLTVGGGVAGNRSSSARFRVIPGFLSAALSGQAELPVSNLDLRVLYAKTDPLGLRITPAAWQTDRDPIFLWDAPALGTEVEGYSYAFDAAPDDVIDTVATSFDVAVSAMKTLADGKHTFSVKALNSAGNSGSAISVEIWVDTTAPQIVASAPAPGTLLNTAASSITATVADGSSGVSQAGVTLLLNGQAAAIQFNDATGVVTATGERWQEGANSLELRVADAVGNAQTPLIWSVTVDTVPPSGAVEINAGATMTTSLYVTLGLSGSDATSGIARVLLSNEEASGYVEEPYVASRELWKLNAVRGAQRVYAKFVDRAGNISVPVSDEIDLILLSPETVITSGPAGYSPVLSVTFEFMCPEGNCVFSYAFDHGEWSEWSAATTATAGGLALGNHYFRVKAAKEVNGTEGIQPDEEDPSPAERTWVAGVEPPLFAVPKGPPIKVWRLE